MAKRGGRGRGRGRGWSGPRGRGAWRRGGWEGHALVSPPLEPEPIEFYPLIRPIFDWTEVDEHFPPVPSVLDNTLLAQLLEEHAASLAPPPEQEVVLQSFITKLCTLLDNMILSGEGESMLLDEVRLVGSHKMGIDMVTNNVGEIVIILRDLPTPVLVSKISGTIVESLEAERRDNWEEKKESDIGPFSLDCQTDYSFKIRDGDRVAVMVYLTTTGEIVYGGPRRDRMITDMTPFQDALRMIRHSRWWEDHTHHLPCTRELVRVMKDMRRHVPGLGHLNEWYLQLLSHCAVVPLVGDEPLSLVGAFRRVWELLSAGLFLPGSIGLPDPCEEGDFSIHDSMPLYQQDELTRNAQMILQMISFGAYREVLAMKGATPINFTKPYSFGGVTLGVPAPAFERPQENELDSQISSSQTA